MGPERFRAAPGGFREGLVAGSGADQAARRMRLHVPAGPPPADGWPLLVLLDGDWVWPLHPAPDGLARCAVLIPSHGEGPRALARRAYDYTPPAPGGGPWPDPRVPAWACGGAEAFLDTLAGPMLDWARRAAPVDERRLALYGHSYGGLCALYAVLRQPQPYTRIISASPSLWWRDGHVATLLDGLAACPPPHPLRLTLMVGDQEQWHPRPQGSATRGGGVPTLPAVRALHERLLGVPGLDCRLAVLEGIGHGEALPASARQAIDLAAQRRA